MKHWMKGQSFYLNIKSCSNDWSDWDRDREREKEIEKGPDKYTREKKS